MKHPAPGCEGCWEVDAALVRIAESVLSQNNQECPCQLETYDRGVRYSGRHGNRPEIALIIRILRRKGFEDSVDASEAHYLNQIQQGVEELGDGPNNWAAHNVASQKRVDKQATRQNARKT